MELKKRNDCNLAEGEITGHAHRCKGHEVAVYDHPDGHRVLDCPDGCDLSHEEHNTHAVPPGRYKAIIAREYDPFAEEARKVVD